MDIIIMLQRIGEHRGQVIEQWTSSAVLGSNSTNVRWSLSKNTLTPNDCPDMAVNLLTRTLKQKKTSLTFLVKNPASD